MPEFDTLTLKDGPNGEKNWIKVRKTLTAGEAAAYRTAGFKRITRVEDTTDQNGNKQAADGQAPAEGQGKATTDVDIDWKALAFARADAYLLEWSATKKLEPSAVRALDPDDFTEIDNAIEAHIKEQLRLKKLQAAPSTMAPSPS
jgi:hypothetical protein